MPSNVETNAGSGGAVFATKQLTHDGDTSQVQMVGLFGLTGTEDSYTATLVNASANGLAVDASGATVPVSNAGLTELAAAINASSQMDVNIAAQAADVTIADGGNSITVDNAGTFAVQVDGAALTALQLIDDIVRAEDAAHVSGDAGVMALFVRQDTQADFGLDGDYVPGSIDDAGSLRVRITANDAGGSGGTSMADDAAFTVGTTAGTPAFAMFDDTAPDSVNEGDGGVLRMSANRNLYSTIRDAAGNERGANVDASNRLQVNIGGQTADITIADGGNSITVDGTVTANLGATDNAVLDQIEVNTSYGDNTGGGTELGALRVTIANDSTGVLSVVGDVAHDVAAAGNPVLVAGRATNSIEGLTQVANADASFLTTDLNGVAVTRPHTTLEEIISERVANTNGTSTAFTNFAAGGAGIHNYITTIAVYNSSGTDGYVDIRDGTAGSIIFTAPAPAAGGSVINLPVPLKGAANTALAYDVSAALSTVYISAVGYQAQG